MSPILYIGSAFLLISWVSATQQCPTGWLKVSNKCYYVSNSNNTFHHNLRMCNEMNATMVSIHSREENDHLTSILPKSIFHWIGLRQDQLGSTLFSWIDGSKMNFTQWAVDEPNGLRDSPWSAVIFNGNWFDTVADSSFAEMCQIVLPSSFEKIDDRRKDEDSVEANRLTAVENSVLKLSTLYQNLADLQKSTHARINELGLELESKISQLQEKMSKP